MGSGNLALKLEKLLKSQVFCSFPLCLCECKERKLKYRSVIRHGLASVGKDISVSLGLTLMLGHGLEPRLTTIAVVCQCIVFNPKLETMCPVYGKRSL